MIDITPERAQAEWYHVTTITSRSASEELAGVLWTASGESRLTSGSASAPANGAPSLV